jgi:hypothetical protein
MVRSRRGQGVNVSEPIEKAKRCTTSPQLPPYFFPTAPSARGFAYGPCRVAPALVGALGMAGMTPAVKRALGEGGWSPDGEGKGQGL